MGRVDLKAGLIMIVFTALIIYLILTTVSPI